MKIKMFTKLLTPNLTFFSKLKEPFDNGLEKEINEWLAQMSNIKIHHIKQTACGGSWAPGKLVVSIFYE
jgi:hypothetical protein